jgi:hypothetical protein
MEENDCLNAMEGQFAQCSTAAVKKARVILKEAIPHIHRRPEHRLETRQAAGWDPRSQPAYDLTPSQAILHV